MPNPRLGCLGLGLKEQFDGGSRRCHISANRFFQRYITCLDSYSGLSSCSSDPTTHQLSRIPLMQALPGLARHAGTRFLFSTCLWLKEQNWLLLSNCSHA